MRSVWYSYDWERGKGQRASAAAFSSSVNEHSIPPTTESEPSTLRHDLTTAIRPNATDSDPFDRRVFTSNRPHGRMMRRRRLPGLIASRRAPHFAGLLVTIIVIGLVMGRVSCARRGPAAFLGSTAAPTRRHGHQPQQQQRRRIGRMAAAAADGADLLQVCLGSARRQQGHVTAFGPCPPSIQSNPTLNIQRLGSPTAVAAPMVQQSDLAFRALARRYGCGLAYTQVLLIRRVYFQCR